MKNLLKRWVGRAVDRYIVPRVLRHVPTADGFDKASILQRIFSSMKSWKLQEGDYLEFGTWRGNAFVNAMKSAERMGFKKMQFYAFDSFEGLPKLSSEAEAKYNHFYEGQFACSQEEFQKILDQSHVDTSRVILTPGFFNDSLTPELRESLSIAHASIVWIDGDLYESTIPVLNWITPLIHTGTFICFDDWFSFGGDPMAGEIRAANEWLAANPQIKLIEYRDFRAEGKVFLVQRFDT